MALPQRTHWTPDDYLAFERDQHDTRHELIDGEIFAMAGASREHDLITSTAQFLLYGQLRGGSCTLHTSEMRVHIPASSAYTYPDLSVTCKGPQYMDDELDTLLNPTLIIEVLSPSTEKYDRGLKFQKYQHIAALQTYVLIAQNAPVMERFQRQPDNQWLYQSFMGLDATVDLPAIGCKLPLRDVYEQIVFNPPTTTPSE